MIKMEQLLGVLKNLTNALQTLSFMKTKRFLLEMEINFIAMTLLRVNNCLMSLMMMPVWEKQVM